MPAPTIVSSSIIGLGAATTSPSITVPATTVVAGDIIVVAYTCGVSGITIPAAPTGFTSLASSTSAPGGRLCAKIAVGGEQSTVLTAVGSNSRMWTIGVVVVRGGPALLTSLLTSSVNGGASATSAVGAVTTSSADALILVFAGVSSIGADPLLPPTGYTLISEADTAAGTGQGHLTAAQKVQVAAGSTGTNNWTTTSGTTSWLKWTVGIPDVAGNSPPTVSTPATVLAEVGDVVSVAATASDDVGISTYAWTVASGSSIVAPTLSGASTATASFTSTEPGALLMTCTVTDAGALTASDTTYVFVVAPDVDPVQVRTAGAWVPVHSLALSP